jgi:hypothetical protein
MIENKQSVIALICAILIGILAGSYILGKSLENFRKGDRYVTVKGFAEREVKADLALWSIRVRAASNDLSEANRSIELQKTKVVQFLVKHGFDSKEVIQQELRVSDKQAREYSGGNVKDLLRYVVEATILLRTKNVDKAEEVSRMTDELVRAGVILSSRNEWQGEGPKFIFTQLNSIKPEMMAEATRNSKTAAVQFAHESSSALGSIRRASQGLFSIEERDSVTVGQAEGGGGYTMGSSGPFKSVRVVVTVDYFLN